MDSAARQDLQQWMARLADGDRSAFAPAFAVLHPLVARLRSPGNGQGDLYEVALSAVGLTPDTATTR